MKQFLYCIEDSLSKMVMPPFSSPNDNVAKRDFIIGAIASNTPLQDLHLWKVGEFNSTFSPDDVTTFTLKDLRELCDPTLSEVSEYSESYRKLQALNPTSEVADHE